MPTLLLEGPFESNYSLSIINLRLAQAMLRMGVPLRLHQRDNTTSYFPAESFLSAERELAPLFVRDLQTISADVHSRFIYPPYTDTFRSKLRLMHNYCWEESGFPGQFVKYFNDGLDLVTTASEFVRSVLRENGVRVPLEVVGVGADHILSVAPKPIHAIRPETFNFLHVSSCFPRKAPEILVRAFCAEFTRRDDVRLIIKSFPNPHNEIERIAQGTPLAISRSPADRALDRFAGSWRNAVSLSKCRLPDFRQPGRGLWFAGSRSHVRGVSRDCHYPERPGRHL